MRLGPSKMAIFAYLTRYIFRTFTSKATRCSPGVLVSSKVRFLWIFAGVHWRGGIKWQRGGSKWRLSLLSLAISSEPSHSRPQLLYCTMYPLSSSSLTPKHMTLNDLEWSFCIKMCFASASNGLAFGFRRKLFGNVQSYPYTVSGKNIR